MWAALLALSLGIFAFWHGRDFNQQQKADVPILVFQELVPLENEAILLHNQAIDIANRKDGLQSWRAWNGVRDSLNIALNLLDSAQAIRPYLMADTSTKAILYNHFARRFNFFLADPDSISFAFDDEENAHFSRLVRSITTANTPPNLSSMHLKGLHDLYTYKFLEQHIRFRDSAMYMRDQLLQLTDNNFFNNIRPQMPVNLHSLLRTMEMPNIYLHAHLLDAQTNKPVPNATLRLAEDQILTSDANGRVFYSYNTPRDQMQAQIVVEGYPNSIYVFNIFSDSTDQEEVKLAPAINDKLTIVRNQTSNACVPLTVSLSIETNKPIAAYDWRINGQSSSTEAVFSPTIDAAGIYSLQLYVTYTDGRRDSLVYEDYFQVEEAPKADFEIAVVPNTRGMHDFRATGENAQTYRWDFGDGQISTGVTLSHQFDRSMAYTIILIAQNTCGTDTLSKEVMIIGSKIPSDSLVLPPLVHVPGGKFWMGADENDSEAYSWEKPIHQVELKDFYIGKYEVTVGEFKAFIDATNYQTDADKEGSSYIWTGEKYEEKDSVNWRCDVSGKIRPESEYEHPVIHVSWNDAMAYCAWLSQQTGRNYRLPTDAEWEYAAGGGQNDRDENGRRLFKYAGSDDLDELGWYNDNSEGRTHPKGRKNANGLGIYDMSGNVYEWCQDLFSDTYYEECKDQGIVHNPINTKNGISRVLRSGSWSYDTWDCRVSYRYSNSSEFRYDDVGFRVAQD